MPKQKLKTVSVNEVKNTYTTKGNGVVLKANRNLFDNIILISQTRKLDMKNVFAHRIGPLSWALANPDGTMCKTNKATLVQRLNKYLSPAEIMPAKLACMIIDGMVLVQKLLVGSSSMYFGEASQVILSAALREGKDSRRI